MASLNENLIELLRRSLSRYPYGRPKPSVWSGALKCASQKLAKCPDCGVPFVSRTDRPGCPFGHEVSSLALLLENNHKILLNRLVTVVGRSELCGDRRISRRHLLFRRLGDRLYVEAIGMNSTCIREGTVWRTLNPSEIIELKPNDRLLVANTPVQYTRK